MFACCLCSCTRKFEIRAKFFDIFGNFFFLHNHVRALENTVTDEIRHLECILGSVLHILSVYKNEKKVTHFLGAKIFGKNYLLQICEKNPRGTPIFCTYSRYGSLFDFAWSDQMLRLAEYFKNLTFCCSVAYESGVFTWSL